MYPFRQRQVSFVWREDFVSSPKIFILFPFHLFPVDINRGFAFVRNNMESKYIVSEQFGRILSAPIWDYSHMLSKVKYGIYTSHWKRKTTSLVLLLAGPWTCGREFLFLPRVQVLNHHFHRFWSSVSSFNFQSPILFLESWRNYVEDNLFLKCVQYNWIFYLWYCLDRSSSVLKVPELLSMIILSSSFSSSTTFQTLFKHICSKFPIVQVSALCNVMFKI